MAEEKNQELDVKIHREGYHFRKGGGDLTAYTPSSALNVKVLKINILLYKQKSMYLSASWVRPRCRRSGGPPRTRPAGP